MRFTKGIRPFTARGRASRHTLSILLLACLLPGTTKALAANTLDLASGVLTLPTLCVAPNGARFQNVQLQFGAQGQYQVLGGSTAQGDCADPSIPEYNATSQRLFVPAVEAVGPSGQSQFFYALAVTLRGNGTWQFQGVNGYPDRLAKQLLFDVAQADTLLNTVLGTFSAYASANLEVKAPMIAENGAVVPVNVSLDGAAGQSAVILFATSNPMRPVAFMRFRSPKTLLDASVRLKLASTGDVVAVAQPPGGGGLLAAREPVQVTIGGIGDLDTDVVVPPGGSAAADSPSNTIRARARVQDGVTTAKFLISHPMETGRRVDRRTGETIPAHFIKEVDVRLNGETLFTGYWGPAISKNPYLAIKFTGAEIGDTVELVWKDNLGQTDSGSALVGG